MSVEPLLSVMVFVTEELRFSVSVPPFTSMGPKAQESVSVSLPPFSTTILTELLILMFSSVTSAPAGIVRVSLAAASVALPICPYRPLVWEP